MTPGPAVRHVTYWVRWPGGQMDTMASISSNFELPFCPNAFNQVLVESDIQYWGYHLKNCKMAATMPPLGKSVLR